MITTTIIQTFSSAVKLRKPDIVPPTAPIATNVMVSKNGVDMDWIQSSSNDVVGYEIYRQQDKNETKLLASISPMQPIQVFILKTQPPGRISSTTIQQ